jgi:hypothetical protein
LRPLERSMDMVGFQPIAKVVRKRVVDVCREN